MSFLQEATEEYLGRIYREDAVPIGHGAWFALPGRGRAPKKEEYSFELAIKRLLYEAEEAELTAKSAAVLVMQGKNIPDWQRRTLGRLIEEQTLNQASFEISAEVLEGNKENLK